MNKVPRYLTIITLLTSAFFIVFSYLRHLMRHYRHEHYDDWTKQQRHDYDSIFANNIGIDLPRDISRWSYETGKFVSNAISHPGLTAIGFAILFFSYLIIRRFKPDYSKLTCFALALVLPFAIYAGAVVVGVIGGLMFLSGTCRTTNRILGVQR